MSVTIGIDVGTTGTKTLLFDTSSGTVASASRETSLFSAEPGFAEADTGQWMTNVIDSIREVVSAGDVHPEAVEAIAVSGMVPAVVPVDVHGKPLRRAILQNDARAHQEVEELGRKLAGTDLVSLTGSALTQQSVAPTLVWLREREPTVYARTARIVGSYDWVLMALGADVHVEQNWALESGLFAVDGDTATVVLDAAALDADLLAPVRRPGTRVGGLSVGVAEQTGLRAGTALIVGGADHVLSAYAAGVNGSGDGLVKLGGAGDILVVSDTQGGRRAAVPGRAPGARSVAAQRLYGHERQPDPLVPIVGRRCGTGRARRGGRRCQRGRSALPALLSRREEPHSRPGSTRCVRGNAPRAHPCCPLPGRARGHRIRFPPSRRCVHRRSGYR